MKRTTLSHLVAVGIPTVGVLGGIIAFHDSHATILGFPIIFAWLFLWMPLTAIVLHVAWLIERPAYSGADGTADIAQQTDEATEEVSS